MTDFEIGLDTLEIPSIAAFQWLNATQDGDDAIIFASQGQVRLLDVNYFDLSEEDFSF